MATRRLQPGFTRERVRSPKGLFGFRTKTIGAHRLVIGCPVKHRGRKCPLPTVAQAILHPKGERGKRRRKR